MNWLHYKIYGSAVFEWMIACAIVVGMTGVLRFAHQVALQRLRSFTRTTVTRLDDFVTDVFANTHLLFFFFVSVYVGAQYLELSPKATRVVSSITIVALLIQAALWGHRAITFWIGHALQSRHGTDGASIVTMSAVGFIVRLVLWAVVTLMILDNLGVNITALIASLGIGGIAVALAVQNILGDIFASLSITLDKPFVIGDLIVAGEMTGVVEHIGLKTTRVRSVSGEQIVLPNAELLKSRIHNYKRMIERRVQFDVGVAPDTSIDTLERIPAMVRAIIEEQPKARFERTHFKAYGEHALIFEIVYFVVDSDYHLYMDIQQAINLALLRRFGEERVGLASPHRAPPLGAETVPEQRVAAH